MAQTKSLLILFGMPAAGKNAAGDILEKNYGYYFYDSDVDKTEKIKENNRKGILNSEKDRDDYIDSVTEKISILVQKYNKVAVASWLPLNKHRKLIQNMFPFSKFILLSASRDKIYERLENRKDHFITKDYALKAIKIFESPAIKFDIVQNNADLKFLENQIEKLLKIYD